MRVQELEVKSQNYWLTVAELRKAHQCISDLMGPEIVTSLGGILTGFNNVRMKEGDEWKAAF